MIKPKRKVIRLFLALKMGIRIFIGHKNSVKGVILALFSILKNDNVVGETSRDLMIVPNVLSWNPPINI